MKKALILMLSLLAADAKAALTAEECMDIDRSVGISMTDVLTRDLKIPLNQLQLAKTQMVLLREEKVDYAFGDYLAKDPTSKEKKSLARLERLRKMYMDDNARNLIIEFTYFNQQNKKAVFIGSELINDNQCSVSSNSYLIVKREF